MKICVKHNVVPWFFRKRTELDIRWPWVWVQTGAQSLCMALGRSLNLSVLLHIYKTQMLKPSIGYRVNIQQTFAEWVNKWVSLYFISVGKKNPSKGCQTYSFSGITAETADQVQNRKLLKAFHSHLCSVQVTSVCLVAGYLTMLAPEARPKLHENLNRLPYKERRHGRGVVAVCIFDSRTSCVFANQGLCVYFSLCEMWQKY